MKKNILALFTGISAILMSCSSLWAFDAGQVQIHGFLSQGFLQTDENNYLAETKDGTFQFNEFGINFSTELADNLRVGVQFFGRDLGPEGNDEVKLDWAYMDYRWKDWMGFRVGKMKLDYALYNETREMDMLRTSIMLPQSIYTELWRDTFSTVKGVGLYGTVPAGFAGSFAYSAQIGALPLGDEAGFAAAMEDSLSAFKPDVTDIDCDYMYTLNLTWNTPLDGLRTKYSFYEVQGFNASGKVSGLIPYDLNRDGAISAGEGLPVSSMSYETPVFRGYFVGLEYTLGDFILAAEFTDGDFNSKINLGYGFTGRPALPQRGWYVSGSYRFTDLLSMALTYSDYTPNMYDEDGNQQVKAGKNDFEAWLKTWTLSSRFDLNESWLLKLEASYNDGFGAYDSMGNNSAELEQYWWLFAAKATVSF